MCGFVWSRVIRSAASSPRRRGSGGGRRCVGGRRWAPAFAGATTWLAGARGPSGPAAQRQAGLFGFSLAVATFGGHTTSNSPFCHWLTVPGVAVFSLPVNLMSPMMVLWVVFAT